MLEARPAGSETLTASNDDGLTVISHRSRRLCTRFAFATVPPLTERLWACKLRAAILIPSLNKTRNLNAFVPSCSAGRFRKLAVSPSSCG